MEPVENLNNKIKRLQKEIDEIQKECKHDKQELSFVEGKDLKWTCCKCKKGIRWPSKDEMEKFFSK